MFLNVWDKFPYFQFLAIIIFVLCNGSFVPVKIPALCSVYDDMSHTKNFWIVPGCLLCLLDANEQRLLKPLKSRMIYHLYAIVILSQ